MAFVSTLGAVSSQRKSVARFPRLRLAGMGDMGAAAAVRSIARTRTNLRLRGLGDDLGRATVSRAMPRTIRYTMRGLGDTCTIDPRTGGRVCTNDPGTGTTAAASSATATPRYLPDPTVQQWDWNNPMKASWIFTGRDNPNSVYDMYMRQDGQAFAAVGPGGGFAYNDPRRATVPAYGPLTAVTPAPVPTPVTPNPVVDASSGTPSTIQPVTPASNLPSPMVATAAPSYFPTAGSTPWGTYALYAGIGLGGLLLLKWTGIIKK
jgi:hypothetical protein